MRVVYNVWLKVAYKLCYFILWIFMLFRYRIDVTGRENIPSEAVIACANHSSNYDPLFLGYAITSKRHVHFMAKAELFKYPFLGWVLRNAGSFPVERDKQDVNAIKTCLRYLKQGEIVALFPEGTRVMDENNTKAKVGAVVIAARAEVPILPVYIARDKRKYKRIPVIVGKPYRVDLDKKTATAEDYKRETVKLMENINRLGAVAQ